MFNNLSPEQLQQLGVVIGLAALPALIWGSLLFKGRKTSRIPLVLAFFLGTLTVLPLLALEYLWVVFPQFDVYRAIELNITEVHAAAFAALIFVGMFEELAKSFVVRIVDKSKIGVKTVNDAVKFSILAGLGFAFTENIFYFFFIWQSSGFVGLIFPLIFRSIFTVAAHMVFSGIFGYFYGISKFSKPIMETRIWMGERAWFIKFFSKFLGTNEADAHRQWTLVKGLSISMVIHAFFNFFLEFELFVPTIILVIGGFAYLLYLLAHKAGAIVFAGMGRSSTMATKDQDVVLELLGMWTKEGRYQDVVDICQRLLMRDPDNKVVQLFQAQAMDQQKLTDVESSFSALFNAGQSAQDQKSMRTLMKQKVLIEMLKEKQAIPAPAPTPVPTPPTVPQQSGPSSPPSSPEGPHIPSVGNDA